MNEQTRIVILAAGKGKRMGADVPKVLLSVGGVPMILRLVGSVERAGFGKPIIVIGHGCEAVRSTVGERAIFVLQKEQRGTGHAVSVVQSAVGGAKNIVVLYGDHPFISAESICRVIKLRRPSPVALMTTTVSDFHDWRRVFEHWGRILKDARGEIVGIKEWKDATDEERRITEVNPGLYCFDSDWLWQHIGELQDTNAQQEFYLTDLVHIAVGQGHRIPTLLIAPEEALGVNSPDELAIAEEITKTHPRV